MKLHILQKGCNNILHMLFYVIVIQYQAELISFRSVNKSDLHISFMYPPWKIENMDDVLLTG